MPAGFSPLLLDPPLLRCSRPFVPYRSPRFSRLPSHPYPHTLTKNSSPVWAHRGGFLPSPPFTLFPSFLLYLSLNLSPVSPPSPPLSSSSFTAPPSSVPPASRLIVLYLRLDRSFILESHSVSFHRAPESPPLAPTRALVILNRRRTQMTARPGFFREIGKLFLVTVRKRRFPGFLFILLRANSPVAASFNKVNVIIFFFFFSFFCARVASTFRYFRI